MSLILDALKRSEAERKAELDAANDSDRYSQDRSPQGRSWLLIVTSVLLVIGVGTLTAFLYLGDGTLSVFGHQIPPPTLDQQAASPTPLFTAMKEPESEPEPKLDAAPVPEPVPEPEPEPPLPASENILDADAAAPKLLSPSGEDGLAMNAPVVPVTVAVKDPTPEEPAPENVVLETPVLAVADPVTAEPSLPPPPQKPQVPEDSQSGAQVAAREFTEKAQEFETKGLYEQAIDAYSQAIRTEPDYAEAYFGRAWAHVTKQAYGPAIRDFTRTIGLSPTLADAHYGLGWAYEQNGQTALAIGEYGETLRLSPGHTNAAFSRGILELYDGRPGQAAEDFGAVYEKEQNELGDFALLWLYVSRLHSGTDASRLASSLADKKSRSPWPGIIFTVFMGEATHEQVIAAMKDPDELSQRKKECAGYFFLGQHRLARGDKKGAREYFRKTLGTGVSTYRQYWAAKIELGRLDQSG